MDKKQAVKFIEENKIVTESGHASVPNFAEFVAGSNISGSWWSHSDSHEIFKMTRIIRNSPEVLVCRLVQGKITYVHKSFWPVLVKLADDFNPADLAYIKEIHTKSGKHVVKKIPFLEWIPKDIIEKAKEMSRDEARSKLNKIMNE